MFTQTHRQAIVTKFLGPTDHCGSRVKATCQAGSCIVPWDHALSAPENHAAAAEQLANRLGDWSQGDWVGGALPNGNGYCFVDTRTP